MQAANQNMLEIGTSLAQIYAMDFRQFISTPIPNTSFALKGMTQIPDSKRQELAMTNM